MSKKVNGQFAYDHCVPKMQNFLRIFILLLRNQLDWLEFIYDFCLIYMNKNVIITKQVFLISIIVDVIALQPQAIVIGHISHLYICN